MTWDEMKSENEQNSMRNLKIPKDLYEEIGSTEKITRLIRVGLLSLKEISLEREIADLTNRTEDLEKRIAELPYETERFQQLLEGAIKDQRILERLLGEKG
jgi:cell division protein FtsL